MHFKAAILIVFGLIILASCAQPQQCLDCLEAAKNCLGNNDQCLGVNMKFHYCYYQQKVKSKFFKIHRLVEIFKFNSFISFVGVLARAKLISFLCFQGALYFLAVASLLI